MIINKKSMTGQQKTQATNIS